MSERLVTTRRITEVSRQRIPSRWSRSAREVTLSFMDTLIALTYLLTYSETLEGWKRLLVALRIGSFGIHAPSLIDEQILPIIATIVLLFCGVCCSADRSLDVILPWRTERFIVDHLSRKSTSGLIAGSDKRRPRASIVFPSIRITDRMPLVFDSGRYQKAGGRCPH